MMRKYIQQKSRVWYLALIPCIWVLSSPVWAGELTMLGRTAPPTLEGAQKFVGAGSCNKEKCHGHATKKRANEYTTWIQAEVHSATYSTLFEKKSKKMAKAFGIKGDPGKSKECSVCHSLYLEEKPDLQGEKYDINEGVTCELCHGPSTDYAEPHAKPIEPKGLKGAELDAKKAELHIQSVKQGMWDAKNLKVRLETCVFCHYQISAKMLDAGHPDISFEMGYFQKTMPAHWEESPDKGDGFPAKVAVASQVISLREALLKLAANVKGKADKKYIQASFDQATSHINMLRAMSSAGIAKSKSLEDGVGKLSKSLGKGDAAATAGKLAGQADKLLGELLKAKYSQANITSIMKAVASDGHLTGSPSQKDAMQTFMLLDSLNSHLEENKAVLDVLDNLFFGLFPEEEGQEPPPYEAQAFGQEVAKLKSAVK